MLDRVKPVKSHFARIFSLSSLVFRTSKFLEFKEFNKTIIPFALVGYETGYSQFGAKCLMLAIYHLISNMRSWNNYCLVSQMIGNLTMTLFKHTIQES